MLNVPKTILLEGLKDEIQQLFTSTIYWQQLPEDRRARTMAFIKQVRELTNNNYHIVMWVARMMQRAQIMFGDEQDAKNNAKRQKLFNMGYTSDSVGDELIKLMHPEQRGQLFEVYNNLLKRAQENKDFIEVELPVSKWGRDAQGNLIPKYDRVAVGSIVLSRLKNVSYRDEQTKKDRTYQQVYDDVNMIGESFKDAKKLPVGQVVAAYDSGVTWNWVDKKGCEQEGSFMGHCGNIASAKPDDSILSLRTNESGMRVPKLTFIYNKKTKTIGEMKGRTNTKPDEKYHDYIVDLLIKMPSPIQINYLQGSGYKPENNFSLNDLNEQRFKHLAQSNPDLLKRQVAASSHLDEHQKLDKQHLAWLKQIAPDAVKDMPSQTYTQKYMQDDIWD